MRRVLLLAIGCLFATVLNAQATTSPPLKRGVNVAAWIAAPRRQPLYARDFLQIKRAGFDNVRLPVDPELLGFSPTPPMRADAHLNLAPLDKALALADQAGLDVVVDMHPEAALVKTLEEDPLAQRQFAAFWRTLATRYKHYPRLAFEILNEPQYYGFERRYTAFVRAVIAAIRSADSGRLIVVGAPRGSSIEGLEKLELQEDTNVIYDFHFYEPYIVTTQGYHAGFEKLMLRYFRFVPYPASHVNHDAAFYAPHASNPAQADAELKEYVHAGWNAARIRARIRLTTEWARRNHVRILCGEFGVMRNYIDPASRYRWLEDVREALESEGIGWQVWDYTDAFGIAKLSGKTSTDPVDGSVRLDDPLKGSRTLEPEALRALGLLSTAQYDQDE